jgi:hypothetical protein
MSRSLHVSILQWLPIHHVLRLADVNKRYRTLVQDFCRTTLHRCVSDRLSQRLPELDTLRAVLRRHGLSLVGSLLLDVLYGEKWSDVKDLNVVRLYYPYQNTDEALSELREWFTYTQPADARLVTVREFRLDDDDDEITVPYHAHGIHRIDSVSRYDGADTTDLHKMYIITLDRNLAATTRDAALLRVFDFRFLRVHWDGDAVHLLDTAALRDRKTSLERVQNWFSNPSVLSRIDKYATRGFSFVGPIAKDLDR